MKFKERKRLEDKYIKTKDYLKKTNWLKNYIDKNSTPILNPIFSFTTQKMNFDWWHIYETKVIKNGEEFIKLLKKDIKNAKKSINLEFYIFSDDQVGNEIAKLLITKASNGVVVNLLYDAFGSHKTKNSFWKKLASFGINVQAFFPPFFKFMYTKINYRNHRKVVVIDGKIAYIGGLNIRDDHMGKVAKLSPWRDTQIRLTGGIVYPLQNIFINDFCYSKDNSLNQSEIDFYFPRVKNYGSSIGSVITSGPYKESNNIEEVYNFAIKNCKDIIYIETPYFIVDKYILYNIIYAKKRGVDVKIIIPKKPDKKVVYAVTLSNIKLLLDEGVSVYLYKGFIHSKVVIFDNTLGIGSCNFDNRSFRFNFENTILFYDTKFLKENIDTFNEDIKKSIKLDDKLFKKLYRKYKVFGPFKKILNKYL